MGKNDKTRVVHYSFDPEPGYGSIDQSVLNVNAVLKKAFDDGTITNYDDGRGTWPWFEGKPGKEIRFLRDMFNNAKRHKAPRDQPYFYCPWKDPNAK